MRGQEILDRLWELRDEAYGEFQKKLLPSVPPEAVIGVRTPALRALAREMARAGEAEAFLSAVPHRYFDENQLHAFILSETKDFSRCVRQVEAFLPFVDNWATCDQLSPKVFSKHREELLPHIEQWLSAKHVYTVRFAVGMLLRYFLEDGFDSRFLDQAARLEPGEYYVDMMVAWYFATALAKQYDAAVPYLEKRLLPAWTHNKAIQKAQESYRISGDRKAYLKTLKV